MIHNRIDARAVAMLVLLCAIWGLAQVAIKVSTAEIPPVLLAAIRSLGAGLLVLAWSRGALFQNDGTLAQGVAAGLLFSLEFVVLFRALQLASASHTVLFLYTSPVFVAVGTHVFVPGERLRRGHVLGLACAIAGVAIAFADVLQLPSQREVEGDALALLAAVIWAATTVLIKAGRLARIDPAKTLFY
ncbi:MAG TPA: DMT family transporter [Caulobacteraceae bacterium]|nr:DMT family transporter [Caulobacteraceae bacterium]